MDLIYLACGGGAAILSCLIVHAVYARLMRDPTNIEFSVSFLIALATGLLLYYGTPLVHGRPIYVMIAIPLLSVLLIWKLADRLTLLTGSQCLLLSLAANASYLVLFHASWFAWTTLTGYESR